MGAPISALAVYLSGVDWFEVLVIGAIVHRMKAKPRGMQDIGARRESGDPAGVRGWHSRGYLPHFDSPDHIQHVTVHLVDSLPKSAIERVDQMIEAMPDGERAIERRKRLHDWIDAGHGACCLEDAECAKVVQDAFLFFNEERYHLYAWVVMPNHFHVLFQLINGWSMAKVVASWKRFDSTKIKKVIRARQESGDPGSARLLSGISEPLWPREYWDRYIRNEKHLQATIAYIE
jgi:putative transposase